MELDPLFPGDLSDGRLLDPGLQLEGVVFDGVEGSGLQREGAISLRVYLDACAKNGSEPLAKASGALNLRVAPELHRAAKLAAKASGKSLNQWASEVLAKAAHA